MLQLGMRGKGTKVKPTPMVPVERIPRTCRFHVGLRRLVGTPRLDRHLATMYD